MHHYSSEFNHSPKYLELELCRAHTPCAHCTIYGVAFVCMAIANNFMNFRKLVEMLLYVAIGGPYNKKHSLCTRSRLLGDMNSSTDSSNICCNSIAILHYNLAPYGCRFQRCQWMRIDFTSIINFDDLYQSYFWLLGCAHEQKILH